tara:strand:- start:1007 stop:2047 length:1041 start_codon:yes stop_codon:yes gene_type:complete
MQKSFYKIIIIIQITLITSCNNLSVSSNNSSIDTVITINNYGSGSACGGSVLNYQNEIYRSFDGGLARMDNELNLEEVSIGTFNQNQVYHVELINNNFWFSITDYQSLNEVHVLDFNGNTINIYQAGQNPGDFAEWKNEENTTETINNTSWIFIANEGSYGASNGTISMIDEYGNVVETDVIGDVVQSIEVYKNKLIVLVNNNHKIKIFDITVEGLSMPGIEISTDGSSPREMVIIDDKMYFTNFNTSDVKVFNLITYNIDNSIPVGLMPEGIETDGVKLWVANSGGSTVSEIDISSETVIANHEVGKGPQNLVIKDGNIYISRTYYSDDWSETYHGASRIIIPNH